MFTFDFLKATAERALKTFAQSAVAYLVAGTVGLFSIDWVDLLSVAGLATVISVLTSVGVGAATGNGPSLVDSEVLVDKDLG